MKKRTMLAALSAVLLILSFPDFNLEFLAWIGFVPLFFAIEDKKPLHAFLIAYLAGIIFFLGTIYWLIHVTLPGMIAVALYLALYFGAFGLVCSDYFRAARRLHLLVAIPAAWVALELVRSHLISGFGWVLLGHSQIFTLPIIQIADVTGAYGVSFLIIMVNVAIYMTIKEVRAQDYRLISLMMAIAVIFIALYYGAYRIKNIFTGNSIRVAVVQGNIPQAKKWDSSFRADILNKYERLTREAASARPELVIWPETSVPGFMESEPDLLSRVTGLARDIKTPLLVGAPREDIYNKDAYHNSAELIDESGRIIGRYDKLHLVPFGEYVPFRKIFAFVENFAPSPIGDFTAGKDYTVFTFFTRSSGSDKEGAWHLTKKVKFSTLICFEDIFPNLARRFVLNGANFLVNITNDAWFHKTGAAYQHVASSVFRAVENRVNMIRAANTGVSCFIDQKGRITDRVRAGNQSTFVDGFAIHEIALTKTRTFYTLYGDVFAYSCFVIALAYLLISKGKKWHT